MSFIILIYTANILKKFQTIKFSVNFYNFLTLWRYFRVSRSVFVDFMKFVRFLTRWDDFSEKYYHKSRYFGEIFINRTQSGSVKVTYE